MSKSLFIFLTVTLFATAASFQSGGPWQGGLSSEVGLAIQNELQADMVSLQDDVHNVRYGAALAPQVLKSFWIELESDCRSFGEDLLAEARQSGIRIPI